MEVVFLSVGSEEHYQRAPVEPGSRDGFAQRFTRDDLDDSMRRLDTRQALRPAA
jgi:hypothetical protein